MNLIDKLEQEEIERVSKGKTYPDFQAGDTVSVLVNVIEGNHKRTQAFEGVVIARRNRGLNSSFIVRKISSGEGVERTFQLYSPTIASIEVKRHGAVRRAKLYYLRDRSGKAANVSSARTRRLPNNPFRIRAIESPVERDFCRGFFSSVKTETNYLSLG